MRRFFLRSFIFGVGLVPTIALFVVLRVLCHFPEVAASRHLEPWQHILFIGDSHIGCTFVETREYGNRVIWVSSTPQQFTLMRLLDMVRGEGLGNIDTVVLDIGLQSLGQQRADRMKERWWGMLPISWRYYSFLPLGLWDRFEHVLSHADGQMGVMFLMPTKNISILTRTAVERECEFAGASERDFTWSNTPERMCNGWEESLHEAIAGIIRVCRENDLRLVFFTAPLTSYYRAAIPRDVEAKLQEFVARIKASGVEYYDLRTWGEDGDFRDSNHLTFDGAKRFTAWFYREILKR